MVCGQLALVLQCGLMFGPGARTEADVVREEDNNTFNRTLWISVMETYFRLLYHQIKRFIVLECMTLYFIHLCAAFGPIIRAKCATPDAGVEAKCFEPFFPVFHTVCCEMSVDVVECCPGDAT